MKANTFIKATFVAINMLVAMLSKGQITFYEDTTITLEPHIPPGSEMPHTTTTTLDSNEVKLVYWIHGLSGGFESWSHVRNVTDYQPSWDTIGDYPARKSQGLCIDYSGKEDDNIIYIPNEVSNQIYSWLVPASGRDTMNHAHSFAIAHSQGGIVARALRYRQLDPNDSLPTYFNGLATFGTPHGGAEIINSSHPNHGTAIDWLTDGCARLGAAEIQNVLNNKWLLDVLVSNQALQDLSMQVCTSFVGRMVLPVLISSIRKPCSADLAPSSPLLQNLTTTAAQDTAYPVVVFYGVEQEPVLWRLVHSMTYTKDNSLSTSILFNDPFGLTEDDELPAEINNMLGLPW
jgi:hypothetical protein